MRLLTNKQLIEAWEHALETIKYTKKDPRVSDQVYVASCWEQGVLLALKKAGYVVVKEGTCENSSSQD